MNSLLLVALLAAPSSPVPGDFHSIADISCPDGAAGCRVELPAWVAQVQPSSGDGRTWMVATERGERLPWRDATDSVAPSETTWTSLPMLPLVDPSEGVPVERLTVDLAQRRFSLDWTRPADSAPADAAPLDPATRWIVDLRAFRGSVLEIVPGPGNFLGSLLLEGGDDLVRWSPRGSVHVARIDSGAFRVRRLGLSLEDRRDTFLRLVWVPVEGALSLNGVRGGMVGQAVARPSRILDLGSSSRGDSGWLFDAGSRSPAVGAYVEFRRRGAYGEFVLETRSASDRSWTEVGTAFGWHRGTSAVPFHNDTAWFSAPIRERFWRVRATGSAATMGDSARLVLRLRPDRIEFPTGGAARLVLAAGMEPVAFLGLSPTTGAIPGDPAHGMVGSPRVAAGDAALVGIPDRRAWILGATLIFAVLAMLVMAWRLWREASRPSRNAPPA